MSRHSNYDKHPCIPVSSSRSECWVGWPEILQRMRECCGQSRCVLCVECYPGVFESSVRTALEEGLRPEAVIYAGDLLKPPRDVDRMLQPILGDDPVFGSMNDITLGDFFDPGKLLGEGLKKAATSPFRVVPYFDPGPWGGHWMEEVCDLPNDAPNHAWCFDCVPEENSLLLGFGDTRVELPAIDLTFRQPRRLLGDFIYSRFGAEFPIRFDFLDTMGGGNLSLQVHPRTEYIRQQFGMGYTQDESYYLLDAGDDGCVYLGVKTGIDREAMIRELRAAQNGGSPFHAEAYVNRFPARKHDHFLIPAGTVHCSGRNSMVLEISATPYIFTFKLWDWGRLGLNRLPRPIHIDHGIANIAWERDTEWVRKSLINRVEFVGSGEGWKEERTGLHELEFIETRRRWFTGVTQHQTEATVNVLNLVEGREATVESPTGDFDPFVVHYAETFIVPAAVGAYTIRPSGESEGSNCATIKASVRSK